ncbi:helix-turn-helix transcriptional regulator [Gulbenkiania mobilis]|uniref:helix-turn-helix transcriptional regulator n=1 Tax=Gulbenkiania mobilis TaxID=397457 RepID=UPI0006BBE18F|nr:response regulator transcription factor [Gulbenkiania mobilis]
MKNVVFLVDHPSTQDDLLTSVIEAKLGVQCSIQPLSQMTADRTLREAALLVMDASGITGATLPQRVDLLSLPQDGPMVVLVNVPAEAPLEQLALRNNVRGIFVGACSPDTLIRGIARMLEGEYWLPREVLQACFDKYRNQMLTRCVDEALPALTRKEVKTLRLIAQGLSNQAIADQLFVSTHTVKTHIYNLYRKLNVNSRSQVVLWALRHLGSELAKPEVKHERH